MYVDDLATGTDSEDNTIRMYKSANEVMNKGGFNLRKGNSNSSRVRKYIANCKNEEFKQIMQKKGDSVMS